jgi:hypothetical protein
MPKRPVFILDLSVKFWLGIPSSEILAGQMKHSFNVARRLLFDRTGAQDGFRRCAARTPRFRHKTKTIKPQEKYAWVVPE